jgi:hypothetical protein
MKDLNTHTASNIKYLSDNHLLDFFDAHAEELDLMLDEIEERWELSKTFDDDFARENSESFEEWMARLYRSA